MAINYASKHATEVDELFTRGSISEALVNRDYDFVGAKTVIVHSVPTVELNDYQREGTNRYGTPAELADTTQELTMSQDKAFTFTVDKGNEADDPALNAGKALKREIQQVVIPTVDKYRFKVMSEKAGISKEGEISKENAYAAFLALNVAMTEADVPTEERKAVVSSAFYMAIKLDPSFIKSGDLSQNLLINGQVGMVDGVPIVLGAGRLPKDVELLIAHPTATTAPHKLSEYKIHEDPPGISGALVEGRDYFDAFVLDNKKNAIAVHKKSDP